MRFIIIPPYQTPVVKFGDFALRELVEDYRKRGALQGVECDFDEGQPVGFASESHDQEFLDIVRAGFLKKAKEYSDSGKYDAIVSTGALDPVHKAARLACKIPVVSAVHSAVHVGSLIGERFSIIFNVGHVRTVDAVSQLIKQMVDGYGLGSKLASVRFVGLWVKNSSDFSQYTYEFIKKYKNNWAGRLRDPDLKKIVDDITGQCVAAIKEDKADSLIIAPEHLQALADGVRPRLDEAGYRGTPIITSLRASLEMAKALVNLR